MSSDQKPFYDDQGFFRRRFPRRNYQRKVGALFLGQYFICESVELGEGGMALLSEFVFDQGRNLVVNFQIPGGQFISLRAIVKSLTKQNKKVLHGLSFENVTFQHRRQIRSFVSERNDELASNS